ncbi:unnamed protein product [Pieris macdunnoughi]|uniref:Uncharacterized protein n=1 Tax=Pieris macdunnoughi TaxID=345717 RepID=A0A821XMD4_9NEOP|nr:unnamed protein product [Pieris macdunnoughi]
MEENVVEVTPERARKKFSSLPETWKRARAKVERSIFNRFYNLGFGSPRTDTCSKCNELLERIKKSTDPSEKVNLMTEKRVHMLKARAFYRLLKEKRDDLVTFSFDCQKNQAPLHIKTVELVFPILDHSFIPPDRVFGLVEKEIKRMETILKPVEYVKGEPNDCADIGSYKSVLKRGKTFIDLNPDSIEKNKVVVMKDKIKDVDALLKKHCGENWKSRDDLDFYKQVILRAENESNETEEGEEVCEVAVPESDLRI